MSTEKVVFTKLFANNKKVNLNLNDLLETAKYGEEQMQEAWELAQEGLQIISNAASRYTEGANFYLKSSELYRDNYNSIKELGIEPRSIEDFAVIEDIMTNLSKLKDLFQSQVPDELYNRI
tara:strand:+ start:991 stop:1353 length:363 start_codon:yes stop_codon:yes gene_type:complete